jgi:hypothetical protein
MWFSLYPSPPISVKLQKTGFIRPDDRFKTRCFVLQEDRLAVKSLWPENEGVTSIPYKINGDLGECRIQ